LLRIPFFAFTYPRFQWLRDVVFVKNPSLLFVHLLVFILKREFA